MTGVFLDFSCKSLKILKCDGYFSPPCSLPPSEADWIPPQPEEWGGGGVRSGGLQAIRSVALVRGPPQILHCLNALNCPGSWRKAIKTQSGLHPRTEAGYRPGGQGTSLRKGKTSLPLTRNTVTFPTLLASLQGLT